MVSRALAFLLAASTMPAVAAPYRAETGLARDYDTGRLLYREEHLVRAAADGRPLERVVLYRCADGTPFARKRIDYRDALEAPDFQFEDARSGYREGVRRDASGREVFVVRPGDAEQEAPLPAGPLVADAGFDPWLREAWPRLANGERVPLSFLVPSRLTSFDFKVYAVDDEADAGERRFRLRLGGWLGWIAPHIDVVYADADRRLLRFEGLSNLRDDAGDDPLKVRIAFPQPPVASNGEAFARVGAEPLRACRVGA